MPYGTIKIDTITFTDGGVDKSVPVSGLVQNPTFTGNITATGTISGNIIQGGTTVSGLTVTGTTANFASGVFTTQVSGVTVIATTGTFTSLTGTTTNGTTASFTTGNFTSLTGTTTTGTTANFASGVFTTQVSGLLITGPTVSATTGTFTSLTGTTTTGTTANFVSGVFSTQVSGVTITGTTVATTTGTFVSLTGTTATFTSGIIAAGTAALPSLAILSDSDTGIYSPGADQLAISTNGTSRLSIDASGNITVDTDTLYVDAVNNRVGVGTTGPGSTLDINGDCAVANTKAYQVKDSGGTTRYAMYMSGSLSPSAGNDLFIGNTLANSLVLYTSVAERLRLTSTGALNFVGAGTAGSTQAVSFNGSAPVDSMVLTSGGLLGIGTSTVDGNIHIADGTRANLILKKTGLNDVTNSSLSTTYDVMQLGAGGSFASYNVETATADTQIGHNFYRHSGGTYRYKYTDTAARVSFNSPGGAIIFERAASGTANTDITFSESMRLDSSGRLGIGTTPSFLLDLFGTTPALRIKANGVSNGVKLEQSSATGDVELNVIDTYPLIFKNANTERCRIDTSGRLLVGTPNARTNLFNSTVAVPLQVEGTGTSTAGISVISNPGATAGNSAVVVLGKTRGSSVGGTTVVASGDELGVLTFQGSDGTELVEGARISCEVDATPGANDMPGRLVFSTTADGASSPTERMRISSSGVFTAFNDVTYNFRTAQAPSASNAGIDLTHSSTGIGNGTLSFRVWTNGDVVNTNNSYGAISDLKLKENIVDATSQWNDLKALQVRKYNFKEETGQETHTQIGLVAQEVELVSPGLVSESPDRDAEGNDLGTVTKSVNYSVLYMKAVKALQEAMERIEVLEQRLTDAGID